MPPVHRKKRSARPAPVFDRLEERALLTASTSPMTHPGLVPAHAVLLHHSTLSPARHALSTVHTAVATRHVTATPHPAVKKAPAPHVAPTRLLPTRATIGPKAHAFADDSEVVPSLTQASPVAGSLNPTQVRTAYGVNLLANQGQGVTVDIIDVYHVPTVANDLSVFSTQFGLPQMDGVGGDPTFTIVSQPGTPNAPVGGSGDTSLETTLDVEWVHAIAPYANIILQEVSSFAYNNGAGGGLLPAVHAAASTPGVVAVSVSYGSTEFSGETSQEPLLAPVAGNPNAIAFSTGDDGYPSFPAISPSVLAVGGTGLYIASARGLYGFETAWGNVSGGRAGGGGVSAYYGAPTFQTSNGVTGFTGRAIPDVSAVGDSLTLVSVYDSYDQSVNGTSWIGVYGTSVAAPVVSGMISLAQQNRINSGLLPLTSPQINAKIYAAYNSPSYSTYFHDIIVGNNSEKNSSGTVTYTGFSAITGYDRATGLGSPVANQFVALLSAP